MIDVVAAILKNKDNKVLIAKRKKDKSLGGYWEFPGGKIENGESPEESLIRELKEEMLVDIKIEKYFGENKHDYGKLNIRLIAYVAEIKKGDIVLNDHDEYEWVNLEELKNFSFTPADVPFVERLINQNNI